MRAGVFHRSVHAPLADGPAAGPGQELAPSGGEAQGPAQGQALAQGPGQEEVLAVGRRIEAALPRRSHSPGGWLDEALMRTCASDEHLRTALFRFIDVRPACRTRQELGEHLAALLRESAPTSARGRAAAVLARSSLTRPLAAAAAGLAVQRVARRF